MALLPLQGLFLKPAAAAAENEKRRFDVPAEDAGNGLKLFAEQAHREIMFLAEAMRGIKTSSLTGIFTPREALARMLSGTPLVAMEDE